MAELTYPLAIAYPVTRPFGDRSLSVVNHVQIGPHTGIDLGAPAGTPVLAAGAGVVTRAGWVDAFGGRMVYLVHDAGGIETRYAHLGSTTVTVGEHVSAGQVIGTSDTSGAATGPHLHFEVIAHGAATCGLVAQGGLCFEDPAPYIGVGSGATPTGVGATGPAVPSVKPDAAGNCPAGYLKGSRIQQAFTDPLGGGLFPPLAGIAGGIASLFPGGMDPNLCYSQAGAVAVANAAAKNAGSFNPVNLVLPALLEPAIAIGVVLGGVVLIYQGFREVLAG